MTETQILVMEEGLWQRERFLTLLNDITRAALETPDLKTMLQTLADRLAELFGADGCYLTLWDEAAQRAIPAAATAHQPCRTSMGLLLPVEALGGRERRVQPIALSATPPASGRRGRP